MTDPYVQSVRRHCRLSVDVLLMPTVHLKSHLRDFQIASFSAFIFIVATV